MCTDVRAVVKVEVFAAKTHRYKIDWKKHALQITSDTTPGEIVNMPNTWTTKNGSTEVEKVKFGTGGQMIFLL